MRAVCLLVACPALVVPVASLVLVATLAAMMALPSRRSTKCFDTLSTSNAFVSSYTGFKV